MKCLFGIKLGKQPSLARHNHTRFHPGLVFYFEFYPQLTIPHSLEPTIHINMRLRPSKAPQSCLLAARVCF